MDFNNNENRDEEDPHADEYNDDNYSEPDDITNSNQNVIK